MEDGGQEPSPPYSSNGEILDGGDSTVVGRARRQTKKRASESVYEAHTYTIAAATLDVGDWSAIQGVTAVLLWSMYGSLPFLLTRQLAASGA